MNRLWWFQFRCLLSQNLKADAADKERLLTPFLFAATNLILFNFVLGDVSQGIETHLFVAEVYLISLFALQMSYSRIFLPDQQDRVFDLLLSYPLAPGAWFLARYVMAVFYGLVVLLPLIALAAFFSSGLDLQIFLSPIWITGLLSIMGLAALGVLLSAMTMKASGKEMLFPLIYFPLTIPVLLAATQASLEFIHGPDHHGWQWLGLLSGFDIIYITLGFMLFGELTDAA
ncbi:MAG: heme exporter protein CcmB [Deltaproteobacteria bacterium]|nr:heme exporter protein CcmB [Deltaproteobacteria bacterium]